MWFVILGVAIALLVGMVVVVVAEALVPSGTAPGPLYVIRGLRKRVRRARRYSQISRIAPKGSVRGGASHLAAPASRRARLSEARRRALDRLRLPQLAPAAVFG